MNEHIAVVLIVMTGIISGSTCFFYLLRRLFDQKAQMIELEKAKVLASRPIVQDSATPKLEKRLRVLEEIVTDRGAETAAQIEALRGQRIETRNEEVAG